MRANSWMMFGLLVSGCGGSGAAVANAAINTGIAVTASAFQRSRGGCYAVCIDGTVCNPANGLCEKRTCARGCGANQFCNRSGAVPMCEERQPAEPVLIPQQTVPPPPGAAPTAPLP